MERQRAHSFFVTPVWARILEAAGLDLRCTALLAADGAQEVLLPLAARRGRTGIVTLRSMPWGTYGGPLTDGTPDETALGVVLSHVRRMLGLGWFVATPGPWPHLALGRRIATYSTQILDLEPGVDALWKGLEKDTRNQVRQAERAGVSIGTALRVQAHPRDVSLSGTVELAEISGSDTFVHVHTPVGDMVAQLTGVHYFALGAPIALYFSPVHVYLFDASGDLLVAPSRIPGQ